VSGKILVSVARDYSKTPGPRYETQGPFSGERFRAMILGKLRTADKVVIDLDGTRGYGSSFIDEVFGGLIRHSREIGLSGSEMVGRIEILSEEDPSYLTEANQAMEDALRSL
jgi:hypothetical protein